MALTWFLSNLFSMAISKKNIYIVDAKGKAVGRIAADIAVHLIGKHKPSFQSHLDEGDFIEVIHAAGMILTGKKMDQKSYYHHSMYPHGLKTTSVKQVWQKDPAEVLRRAVSRMLPKNSWRKERMKRLTISN